jgi:methylenetetrahydrofolate dehydrogenase (NADP+)/methenyltetrahydrofolate cyclohydrolase
MTTILDGKTTAAAIRAEVATGVQQLLARGGRAPRLEVLLVGENPASQAYVRSKTKACAEVGMFGETRHLPADLPAAALEAEIDRLNADPEVDGILVQLPLPKHLSEQAAITRIAPEKDVDGFHPTSVGHLWRDEPGLVPCTPLGVIELLRRYQIPLTGKRAVIVGRSTIVGKPMAALLLREQCTVTVCHSRTQDLPAVCREADILVAAIGRAGMIGPEHVREGAVVIDVGINRVADEPTLERLFPGDSAKLAQAREKNGVLVGDVDYLRVAPRASAITPVPGGVGPLTVAMLIANTLQASIRRQGL